MEAINQEKKKGNGRLRVTPPKKDKEKAADQGNASDVTQPAEDPAPERKEDADQPVEQREEGKAEGQNAKEVKKRDGMWGTDKVDWIFPSQ
jgi:hypothetical protein